MLESSIITNKMMNWVLVAIYALTTASGLVLLKLGTSDSPIVSMAGGKANWNISALSLAGIALYGVSFLLYTLLISRFDLGYIVPLTTALVYALIFVASFAIFHEVFTTLKIVGILLILGGVILLNTSGAGADIRASSNDITTENSR